MTSPISKVTNHYRNKISGEMKFIEVPEWDNLKIFYKSTITMKEQGRILKAATEGNQLDAIVEALIIRARNEDESRMFTMADKVSLQNEADPAVIIRVVATMNEENDKDLSLEEATKN